MAKLVLSFCVLFMTACLGDPDVDRQQNLLNQIETKVTVTFEDLGPEKTNQEGSWRAYKFKFSNEYHESVWVERISPSVLSQFDKAGIPEAFKVGNPQAYCCHFEVKDQMWSEKGGVYGSPPHYFVEIPSGQEVEFVGYFRTDVPDIEKKVNKIRGVVTVYCDPTDINGRHIISAPLPFTP